MAEKLGTIDIPVLKNMELTKCATAYFDPKSESRNERAERLKAESAVAVAAAGHAAGNGSPHLNGDSSANGITNGLAKSQGL